MRRFVALLFLAIGLTAVVSVIAIHLVQEAHTHSGVSGLVAILFVGVLFIFMGGWLMDRPATEAFMDTAGGLMPSVFGRRAYDQEAASHAVRMTHEDIDD